VKNRKVLIKSELSGFSYNNVKLPIRIFTALTPGHRSMGGLNVMVGRFQMEDYQYCLAYDLYIKPLFRRRHIAQKLVMSAMRFVEKENFKYLNAILKKDNHQSISLFIKLGFELIEEADWKPWERKEASVFKVPVNVVRYTGL